MPFSGQLYSHAIEPLLWTLKEQLTGLHIEESTISNDMKLSAYAYDVTVIIRNSNDMKVVLENLKCYGRASSVNLNLKVRPYGVVQRDIMSCIYLIMSCGENMILRFWECFLVLRHTRKRTGKKCVSGYLNGNG